MIPVRFCQKGEVCETEKKENVGAEAIREALLEEALSLPETPGVYVMHDAADKVIYVGKSRRLRDRVSQYFRTGDKGVKTNRMTAAVRRFECIFCDTEMEALTLENTLIKQYSPRYNIKLKDAKSYPYIKLLSGEYPRLVMTRRRADDGGRYFGPYSGTSTVFSVISLVNKAFGLPSCKRSFPRDVGKGRPCIYYQMGQCSGVCTGGVSREEYSAAVAGACDVLRGNVAPVMRSLEEKMMRLAAEERFEEAAKCRDTICALGKLSQKQKAVASPSADKDVVGVFSDEVCTAMSLIKIRGGAIIDKLDFLMGAEVIADGEAFVAQLFDHYRHSEDLPRQVLFSFEAADDDVAALAAYLAEASGRKTPIVCPKRGESGELCEMACENARQAALKYRRDNDREDRAACRLASLLALEVVPERIEAWDISNVGNEHVTAGMIVSQGGKLCRADYRSFNIKTTLGADDYGALREALTRRLAHIGDGSGSLACEPDLILLDGGAQHLAVAQSVLCQCGASIPVAAMVKDDNHRTRALVTENGEVNIARERELYVFLYKLQEEVHRYTVSKMTAAKRKTLRTSSLEKINGIGAAKARKLLAEFGSPGAIKKASVDRIAQVKGISHRDAEAVVAFFGGTKNGSE